MSEKPRQRISSYNLVLGEDSYAGQNAQDPTTARRLKSLIPSLAGELEREKTYSLYTSSPVNPAGNIGYLFQFDRNDANGVVTRRYYAATSNKLFEIVNGVPNLVLSLAGYPQAVTKDNRLHLSDGVNNYLFDGTSWVNEGFPIPSGPPGFDLSQNGTLNVTTNRYYWTTFADQTATRIHESTSSPISAATGPLANKKVRVTQRVGTASFTSGSTLVTGTGTDWSSKDVGLSIFINSTNMGTIASVASPTSLTLTAPAPVTASLQFHVIVPARATHWHIYASESENSKVGKYLASVPVTVPFYDDESPFIGQANSLFQDIDRPFRNDAAPGSSILTVHKSRIFRRRNTRPNFVVFSANEEVRSEANGSAPESYPGADPNTQSDIVNEFSYPDESNRVRAMTSHGDALYIGTERNVVPLYGESIDDFAIAQVTAFSVGIAGRYASVSTPYGLAFMSYDRKLYLYPSAQHSVSTNVTSSLVELGRPMRKVFENIDAGDLDNVRLQYYHYGRRNWLVIAYRDNTATYHTWVYDFETHGWFELQRGYVSLAVFEVTAGRLVLVGGGTDGNVYVIDDLTGTYTSGAARPAGTFRTALMHFGNPDMFRVFRYLEFELTNPALASDITVNYWLDPSDVDNPGTPRTLTMTQVKGANLYRGFATGGNICKRLLVEINVASSATDGAIRGINLVADPAAGLIR